VEGWTRGRDQFALFTCPRTGNPGSYVLEYELGLNISKRIGGDSIR
jgi:hypothetical protein